MDVLTTNGITISVQTQFLPDHSDPRNGKFIFGYFITIENGSNETVQLLRRHWLIQDSNGTKREVDGDGVIGQQPILNPGDIHAYSSFCDLSTDIGKMSGAYLMLRVSTGTFFEATVPPFKLVAPFRMN